MPRFSVCMSARQIIGNVSAPVDHRMRYSALFGAILCAVLSEVLSFAGREVGVVMGRATMLLGPVAFTMHVAVALAYGAVLAVVIDQTRGWLVWARGLGVTTLLYAANAWASASLFAPRLSAEPEAVFAHGLFAFAFICLYKMGEDETQPVSMRGHAAH